MSNENKTPSDSEFVNVEGTYAEAWEHNNVGDRLVGVFLGAFDADGKRGKFKAYHILTEDGRRLSVSGASLNTKMPQIPRKTRIAITYKGTQTMDRGEMKLYDVAIPKGVKLIDPLDQE